MAIFPQSSWHFKSATVLVGVLLSSMLSLVLVHADDSVLPSLHIQPINDITATADERVRIAAVVDSVNNQSLAYIWEQKGGPTLVLRNDMTDTVYFVAPRVSVAQHYQLMVLVSDGISQVHADVTVTVLPAQLRVPVANAGADQFVKSGDMVTLDASLSSDEDSLAFTYAWKQLSGPTVVLAPTHMTTVFWAPQVTTTTSLEFAVDVTDESGTSTDSVKISVLPNASASSVALPAITTPIPQTKPTPEFFSSSMPEVLAQSDLRRNDILREAYYVCFPDQAFTAAQEASFAAKLLAVNKQDLNYVGVTKIDMLQDVLVVCNLVPEILPVTTSTVSHYTDITTQDPAVWDQYANYAFDHHLFDDQPLFLPNKVMSRTDLKALLSKLPVVQKLKQLSASVSSEPSPATTLVVTPPPVVKVIPNQNASASVLSKVLEPKVAAFGILFLVGFFCICYALIYSFKPVRQKNTYISLSTHDKQ